MRKNFEFVFMGLLMLVVAGFGPTYFWKNLLEAPWQHHLHGLSMTAWFVIVIIQALFIKKANLKAHKILGYSSVTIVTLLVISVYFIVQWSGQKAPDRLDFPGFQRFLLIPITDTFFFVFFYVLALKYRKQFHTHICYILGATIFLLPPATSRLQFHLFPKSDWGYFGLDMIINVGLILLLMIIDAVKYKKIYKSYLVVLGSYLLVHFTLPIIMKSEWWTGVAKELVKFL